MVVVDMLLKLRLSFASLGADLTRVSSILFNHDILSIFTSAVSQMPLSVPCCLVLLVALRALLVLGCVEHGILLALPSQHFAEFPAHVRLIRFF